MSAGSQGFVLVFLAYEARASFPGVQTKSIRMALDIFQDCPINTTYP